MACCGLLHPQVNVDLDAVEDKIKCGKYRPDASDQPQPLQTVDAIVSRISEVWSEPPPHGHLHVLIDLPEADSPTTSSKWFFSAPVLGPYGNPFSCLVRLCSYEPLPYVPLYTPNHPDHPSLGIPFDEPSQSTWFRPEPRRKARSMPSFCLAHIFLLFDTSIVALLLCYTTVWVKVAEIHHSQEHYLIRVLITPYYCSNMDGAWV
jgi:hypothetical protein